MGKTKFTPTPWRRFVYGNSRTIGIEDSHGQIICDVFESNPVPVLKKPGISTEEKLANVSLLESAPEMYSMLQSILDDCEICTACFPYPGDITPRQQIEAVLKKARGEK